MAKRKYIGHTFETSNEVVVSFVPYHDFVHMSFYIDGDFIFGTDMKRKDVKKLVKVAKETLDDKD